MKTNNKFLRAVCIMLITALFICYACACSNENPPSQISNDDILSVHYIDVGNGDCIFINFHDGKNMLIDCGAESQNNLENIAKVLKDYSVSQIDYLVLTHPDLDHVGNAQSIVKNYIVKKAYIPNIYNKQLYPSFAKAVMEMEIRKVEIAYSTMGDKILADEYIIAFLSPCWTTYGDAYGEFNGYPSPTDTQVNNLSPIIYLEYAGVTFLFTGDAGYQQEKLVENNCNIGMYDRFFENRVKLNQIDFLKVAHHGAEDCSSQDFLNIIQPKNAIISVGGDNVYGHPSSLVINRLYASNQNVNVLRTDVYGTISVTVNQFGDFQIDK